MADGATGWIGRVSHQRDRAEPSAFAALSDLLDHDAAPLDRMPPLGHWLRFLPGCRISQVGPDGHPERGGDLPPVDLPRRMWASGDIRFRAPVPLGASLDRKTTIAGLDLKEGRSGRLA